MKKLTLFTILVLCLIGMTGCNSKKKNIELKIDDIKTDTMLVKNSGQLQVATVEDFDKKYYQLSEFEEFAKKNVDDYNKTTGEESVKLDGLEIRDNKAIMILSYTSMQHYISFNKMPPQNYFLGTTADTFSGLPNTLINKKEETETATDVVMQNAELRVLALQEAYDVIVEGNVKYYSSNAKPLDSNKVQSTEDQMTVIVYKPNK